MLILGYIFFNVNGADSNVSSNVLLLRKTGRVDSEVDLLVSIGISSSSCQVKLIDIISKSSIHSEIHY